MARIDIKSGGTILNDGVLQLENGVAMDTTLRNVADQNNTTSPLLLSTTAVQVESPLRITTDDPSDMYLDCEDGATNNRFNITRNTASQQVNLNFASNPAGSTTTVGAIRTYGDGVNLSNAVTFREDGQVTFTERVNIEADSLVTTESSSVIAASTTNANLVIAPNGTGALIVSIPDGTATGGNARGDDAVDLQIIRGAATNVASGNYSVISGGQSNTASTAHSTVSGGQSNTATGGTHATVVGGQSNTSSGAYSISGGFTNTASGESAVALGRNNIASSTRGVSIGDNNNNSTSRGVAIGHDNTVTQGGGQFYAVAIGNANTISSASGSRSYAFGESNNITANGIRNTAIGYASTVSGSANNAMAINSATATANYSLGKGLFGVAYYYNGETRGGFNFNGNVGTAQTTDLIAAKLDTLTTGGTTTLSLDGTGTTNLIIPNGTNRMWNVTIKYVAVVTTITGTATGVTVGDTKSQNIEIGFKKLGGVSSLVGAGSFSIPQEDASMSSASLIPTAGASQELALTFTAPTFAGGGSVTCRVVAKVELVEVAY